MTQEHEKIKAYLRKDLPVRFDFREEVTSTNTLLKQIGAAGEAEGYVMVARRQNSGRGRLGRSFLSPDSGIYMSVLLRPKMPVTEAVRITCAAGVAVAEAIREVTGREAVIKWVNDVYISGRKVCGILTESVLSGDGGIDYAVLGIGINLETPEGGFDKTIQNIAGAVYEGKAPEGAREHLIVEVWNRFFTYYEDLKSPELSKKYRELCFLTGRDILVYETTDGQSKGKPARVITVDDDFGLTVRYESGETETLVSGEVSVRTV